MTADMSKLDPHFMQLVLSLQAAAMQQMGKVINPMTSKIDRDLMMAQNSIDMLAMLDNKMKNNLSDEENQLIEHVLYELRLNYVDESNKKVEPAAAEEKIESTAENTDTKKNE